MNENENTREKKKKVFKKETTGNAAVFFNVRRKKIHFECRKFT